jgi:nitrogen regulatory protein P-II 1
MNDNITYLTDVATITCVVKQGMSDTILQAARDVGAITGAISFYAHGHGARERLGLLGITVEAEKEIISLLVSLEQKDTVFEALFRAANLDKPGSGYIYCTPLEKLATYVPQDMINELEGSA